MKRSIQAITEDLVAYERMLGLIKRERKTLREEWLGHEANILKQLEMWDIPKEAFDHSKIQTLLVDYEPHADSESAGAGTVIVEREDWSVLIEIDSERYDYFAQHWTGGPWEANNFHILNDDASWDVALQKNDSDLAASIASMGLAAFLKDGEDSILKFPSLSAD
jgi:hypothetical protein